MHLHPVSQLVVLFVHIIQCSVCCENSTAVEETEDHNGYKYSDNHDVYTVLVCD
jgi:hypothetical protein